MLIEHRGQIPHVHPSAYVAPTAVLCGAVRVGPEARVLFGAVLTAEDGEIMVGARCVIMENALIRGRAAQPVVLGDDVLVGPHAHVNGARVGDGAFLATGSALFPGCEVGAGAEVRIHGVVHVGTVLAAGAVVPIGWIAVGDPAQLFPPGEHDRLWPAPGHCAEQKATTSNSSPLVSGTPGNRSRPLPAATSIRLSSIPKMTGS